MSGRLIDPADWTGPDFRRAEARKHPYICVSFRGTTFMLETTHRDVPSLRDEVAAAHACGYRVEVWDVGARRLLDREAQRLLGVRTP